MARASARASELGNVPEGLGDTLLEIVHHDEDGRCAVYARVTTPGDDAGKEPVVWTGWSAYGAGAGLEEDDEYHRGAANTAYHDAKLKELFGQNGRPTGGGDAERAAANETPERTQPARIFEGTRPFAMVQARSREL